MQISLTPIATYKILVMRGLGLMDRNGEGVHLGCHRFRDDLKTAPRRTGGASRLLTRFSSTP